MTSKFFRSPLVLLGLVAGLLAVGVSQSRSRISEVRVEPLQNLSAPDPGVERLEIARCQGKYSMLLRQFKSPPDVDLGTDFKEMGYIQPAQHGGRDAHLVKPVDAKVLVAHIDSPRHAPR